MQHQLGITNSFRLKATMADKLSDQLALFNQYDSEYCSKATDVARKVQIASSLGPGECRVPSQGGFFLRPFISMGSDDDRDAWPLQTSEEGSSEK